MPFEIKDRWSDDVIQAGFTAVPIHFLRRYSKIGLTAGEAMLLIHIMAYKWDEDLPFPSVPTIAREMGLSVSQVRTKIAKLEKKGFLRRIYRTGKSTLYDPSGLIDALEDSIHQQNQESPEERRSELIQGLMGTTVTNSDSENADKRVGEGNRLPR